MSENLRLYTVILFGFEHVLRAVPADAWENQSPCEEWTTRQVAGHAMGVVNNVAARGGVGAVLDPFDDVATIAGADPVESFRQIRDRYLTATDRRGALQTPITSRLGVMTLDEYIGLMCADTLVHTWDIARAAGVDDTLDRDAVRLVYAGYVARDPETMRQPGRYGAAVELGGADSSLSEQDRLIAFTGRDPSR
jgi:uncharacterized protein (TIGR03086 family)